ncbi:MAG: PDZ domain-containing protein [Actinobacteria bacterium]|nr:MAG: PDZ domain-containing protein [Actinomycetota bacterium]
MLTRLLSPVRLAAAGAVVLAAAIAVGVTQKSDKFLELPDPAHPLTSLVRVPGGKPHNDGGGIYYVDVLVKKASLLQASFSFLRPNGADLVKQSSIVEPGISYQQQLKLEQQTMKLSQEKASIVALRALGLSVHADDAGVRVVDIERDSHARGVLKDGDVVVAADGHRIHNERDLFLLMAHHRIGDVVSLAVERGKQRLTFRIKTIGDNQNPGRAIIGFIPFEVLHVRLPFHIGFNLQDVGGPSAGLAFALEVLEQRGRDVDHGLKLAATGEIQLNGTVTRIGGVKQKTIGARDAHVDAFLVPVDGDNAKVAKRYAHGLRIIPVKTFQQALQALATLRPKA